MQKRGKTSLGKQRWFCISCRISCVRKRDDVSLKRLESIASKWIVDGRKLKHLAEDYNVSMRTIERWIEIYFKTAKSPKRTSILSPDKPLLLDGIWVISKEVVTLIAHDGKRIIDWKFVKVENYETWKKFLNQLKGIPLGIVSDGQKGLKKAISERFGNIAHQRCRVHVTRQAKLWLTKYPRTSTGKELLLIVDEIDKIQTHASLNDWRVRFEGWQVKHAEFLKEKSIGPTGKSWYTHRKIRAVRSLILGARLTLFTYLDHNLPATTNALEGGENSPLRSVIREHRGISGIKKLKYISLYLASRM
jgi:hypothetical protein